MKPLCGQFTLATPEEQATSLHISRDLSRLRKNGDARLCELPMSPAILQLSSTSPESLFWPQREPRIGKHNFHPNGKPTGCLSRARNRPPGLAYSFMVARPCSGTDIAVSHMHRLCANCRLQRHVIKIYYQYGCKSTGRSSGETGLL